MGTVLKVVMIPRESWHDLEEVVLEEMTVFRVRPSNTSVAKSSETTDLYTLCVCFLQDPTPITAMELSTKQVQACFSLTATFRSGTEVLRPYFPVFSNSCTWARLWASPRCRCTAVRCTGKPAPSAAWPGTLTAPGTAPSVPDTSPPPRGRRTNICSLFPLSVC